MKRFILSCQVVIVAFFFIKILFLMEAPQIESIPPVFSLDHFGQAIAQTTKPAANAATTDPKDVADDPLKKERDLFVSLQKRQKELDMRESSLKVEEEKILALKKEITEKIDALKSLKPRSAPNSKWKRHATSNV
jgi:anti-sigma28 factor (negative regulator of flagellin synthesis)